MIAVDFGANRKLQWYGPDGPIVPPRPSLGRGLTDSEQFVETLRLALLQDDVVTESATPGSSGAEAEMIWAVVQESPNNLWTISTRAVKNRYEPPIDDDEDADQRNGRHPIPDDVAARLIYEIATQNPSSLKRWRFVSPEAKFVRKHRSVRPHDKRGYKTPEVAQWMANLPPFHELPLTLQQLFGDKKQQDYNRPTVLPLAQALEEDGADTRDGYERVIGLYAHGYPCHYRRTTVVLMHRVAKGLAGTTKVRETTRQDRKEAWKIVRRSIRNLWALSKRPGKLNPDKGNRYPVYVPRDVTLPSLQPTLFGFTR